MSAWLLLFGGGILLYLGAEWLVFGTSSLARALRIPQLIVDLTVVAYGTSTPEVIVGIQAARNGCDDPSCVELGRAPLLSGGANAFVCGPHPSEST